ncbi:MAG: hypothetical protein JO323_12865 [Acidobacteriia bacterium]|nr:hypothetical protein [Terriglobia bacterium]
MFCVTAFLVRVKILLDRVIMITPALDDDAAPAPAPQTPNPHYVAFPLEIAVSTYGFLPPSLLNQVRGLFLRLVAARLTVSVSRSE